MESRRYQSCDTAAKGDVVVVCVCVCVGGGGGGGEEAVGELGKRGGGEGENTLRKQSEFRF